MHKEDAPDHQKISFTAKLVALGRSATQIPFAREVSDLIGAPALGESIAQASGIHAARSPLMVPFVEARYWSLVSAIKRSGVRQVLEFASGVSLRGLSMTLDDPGLTYIETDLPDLTAEKRKIMVDILAGRNLDEPPRHHIFTANILDWDEIELALAPLNSHEPVAVIHEGLFMYLSHHEKRIAAQHIARILDRFGGVWITPDFTPVSSMMPLQDNLSADDRKVIEVIEEWTERNFAAHSFASEEEAQSFCEKLGFTVEERPQLDGSYVLSSLPSAEDSEHYRRLQEGLKLWEMRRPPLLS